MSPYLIIALLGLVAALAAAWAFWGTGPAGRSALLRRSIPPPPPPPVEPAIFSIRAHQLRPGDLVVVHLRAPCNATARDRIEADFRRCLPARVGCLVVWGIDRTEILRNPAS